MIACDRVRRRAWDGASSEPFARTGVSAAKHATSPTAIPTGKRLDIDGPQRARCDRSIRTRRFDLTNAFAYDDNTDLDAVAFTSLTTFPGRC